MWTIICILGLIFCVLSLLGGYFPALGGIIVFGGFLLLQYSLENKVDNYDMKKVSTGKMAMDAGKSKSEIKRNLVNGKYDKDSNWKI